MNLILPFDSLGEENLPLALSDRVSYEPEALLQPVVEIANKQVVHIREVKPVVADVEVLLQLNGVVHRLDGFGFLHVLTAEDEKAHLVVAPIKAVPDLGDLAFEDTPEGEGHRPVGELLYADILPFLETIGIAVFEDLVNLFAPRGGRDACDIPKERFFGLLALFHGSGDLDADGTVVPALEVGPVTVNKAVELAPEKGREGDLRVAFKKAGSERTGCCHILCHILEGLELDVLPPAEAGGFLDADASCRTGYGLTGALQIGDAPPIDVPGSIEVPVMVQSAYRTCPLTFSQCQRIVLVSTLAEPG